MYGVLGSSRQGWNVGIILVVAGALAGGTSWSPRTTKRLLEPGRMVLRWSPRRVQSCGGEHATRTEPDRKEDGLDRGSNKAEREAAFQKLQGERVTKNL